MAKRWDGDRRGKGIGSGAGIAFKFDSFLDEIKGAYWLTEDPAQHLAPKLRDWLAGPGAKLWTLHSLGADDAGWLEVRVEWLRAGRARDLRADVLALIGSFAEAQTLMVSDGIGINATLNVATGQPSSADYSAHGHLVRVIPNVHPSGDRKE